MGGSTISMVIEGDDLRVVRVAGGGVLGARAESVGVAASALSPGGADRVREVLRRAGSGRLVLTVPSAWAAVRAIPMTVAQWRDGEDEIRRSVGGLLPLSSEDAMLGLIETPATDGGTGGAGSGGSGGGGYLIGVSAAQVRPWLAMIERAAGRGVDTVMTLHMAMLGLGLQEYERADVIESGGDGEWGGYTRHRLSHGLFERLGEAWSEDEALADHAVVIGSVAPGTRARAIGGDEIAVGAALAPRVAGEAFVALDARASRALGKWLLPLGGLAAAAVLFVAGGAWHEARMEGASQRLDARMAQISAEVEAVSALRVEALETGALIESARRAAEASGRKMLPALTAAMQAVPEGGFAWTIEVSRDGLVMRGEEQQSGAVIARIENSAEFEGARQISPVTTSRNGGQTFDLTANRSKTGGRR